MKLTTLLPLAALSTALVIPDEAINQQLIAIEAEQTADSVGSWFNDKLSSINDVAEQAKDIFEDVVEAGENAIDTAMSTVYDVSTKAKNSFQCHKSMMAFDANEWLESGINAIEDMDLDFDIFEEGDHPHHPPPPHHKRPHHPPHHKKPHHGDHKPNLTVYELIAKSKYTTKLAKLINKYPNLVEALNGTASNFTVFAPTDKAFEKIPDHHKDISEELLYQILAYHISPDFYPAGRVLVSHTIPTMKKEEHLGGESQRLRVGLGLKGLAVNFYSRIVAINIFGTNGVIHGVDSLILPPPPATKIIELLPGEFSTLQLALTKTGLDTLIKESAHNGGTFFAPSNYAFQKLGPRINAFLFSSRGEKYLKSLLAYHIVANQTLYSDAYYNHASSLAPTELNDKNIPKGRFHIDLPTILRGKSLSVDVARWGGFISIRINGYNGVAVQDGIAKDGVIHAVSSVLIPPKSPGAVVAGEEEDLSVEEFMERFDGWVDDEEVEL